MSEAPIGWIPKSQRDTRWYIWNSKFQCRIPQHQAYTEGFFRNLGIPSSLDPGLDRALMEEDVDRYMSINDMVEYYRNGISVKVKNYKDTGKIYELISNHLNAWKQEILMRYTMEGAPLDDLILLDEFANVVYGKAKYQFNKQVVDSLLARRMSSLLMFNKTNILVPKSTPVVREETPSNGPPPDTYPQRESFDAYFKSFQSKPR